MNEGLKQKTISSMLWNSLQRFGCAILSFISNIVLARLLFPEDFGCIGMLTIFIAVSDIFVDGGFGAALIQKMNADQKDYSTIFYWNIIVSIVFYSIIYITSPFISKFYHLPLLCELLRVLAIIVIINALGVIHTTILTKELKFKRLSIINLVGTIVGVIASILCALYDWGVWSLVVKSIITSTVIVILLWNYNNWKPSLSFSFVSFKGLFNFGFLMFASKLLTTIFNNSQSLVIGRVYSPSDLGYFTQARKLDEIPSFSLSQIVTQVSFPVFSKISNELTRLRSALRKNLICINFIIFPLQSILILLGDEIIVFLFSERWIESATFFKILCFYGLFVGAYALNTNIYKAIGSSKTYFYIQTLNQVIGLILLILSIRWGIKAIAASISVSGFIWWITSAFKTGRILNYGIFSQIKDVMPSFIISVVSYLPAYFILHYLKPNALGAIAIGVIVFLSIYIFLSGIFNKAPFNVYKEVFINLICHRVQH